MREGLKYVVHWGTVGDYRWDGSCDVLWYVGLEGGYGNIHEYIFDTEHEAEAKAKELNEGRQR